MNDGPYDPHSYKLEDFWTDETLDDGFVAVPISLIRMRTKMGLNSTEFLVLVTLLSYKYANRPIFPTVATLCSRCGLEERTVRRATSRFENLGLICKGFVPGRSTHYDLSPLVEELTILMTNASPVTGSSTSYDISDIGDMSFGSYDDDNTVT